MKIGIVGPKDSAENIAEKLLKVDKDIHYSLYIEEEISEVTRFIDICQGEVDALILTGNGVNHFFHSQGTINIPTTFIHRKTSSLVSTLWRVRDEMKDLDSFSLDVVTEDVLEEVTDELHLNKTSYLNPYSPHLTEEDYINWHKTLYDEGKTRFMLTGFGAVYTQLKNLGYPVYRLHPTYTQVRLAYQDLINKLRISKLKSSQIAVQIIRIKGKSNKNYYEELNIQNSLEREIISYVRDVQGALYSSGRDEYIISGTRGSFKDSIVSFLKLLNNTQIELCSGIGYGHTAYEADVNARNALAASLLRDGLFVLDEDGHISGPINKTSLPAGAEAQVIDSIREATGLPLAYLQRLQDLRKRKSSSSFDSKEIAGYLEISERSARRVITKLLESGYGTLATEEKHSQGRPKKIIKINF